MRLSPEYCALARFSRLKSQVLALLNAEGIALADEGRAHASLSECVSPTRCLAAYHVLRREHDTHKPAS